MTEPRTIYALATPPGMGALAVVRLSGAAALAALQQLSGKQSFAPRMATRVWLRDPETGAPIDDGMAVYFPAPHSFTGEETVEFTLHGGRATVQGTLAALAVCEGLRIAEPGEFTRRAFENGKLDLTQAEAIADLIHAETSLQRAQALGQLAGALRDLYHDWATCLTTLLAHAEAEIDFPDEDLPDGTAAALSAPLQKLTTELQNHLSDNRRGERLRDGITVVILGAPNAGKSTLLNTLAQRDVAIVTDIPGTTRDVLEVHLDLSGYPVTLLDTAGLRETHDAVESEGIRRARTHAEAADLKLCLFDAGTEMDAATEELIDENTIIVLTKKDRPFRPVKSGNSWAPAFAGVTVSVSAKTGEGIDALLDAITRKLETIFYQAREAPSLTRARHREALEECLAALHRAGVANLPELIAEDLRLALRALGRITGRVDVEDLLDKIFKDFCVGK